MRVGTHMCNIFILCIYSTCYYILHYIICYYEIGNKLSYPILSHSGAVGGRPGPCVGGVSPSAGGWEPGSGSVPVVPGVASWLRI